MDKLQKDIFNIFIDDITKINSVCIEVGVRHSGKSLFSMSVLSYCLKNKMFDSYHLVLPTYKYQRNGTFGWIDRLNDKDQSKITIYESFSLFIIEDLIRNRKKNGNTLFMVDDATSFLELFGQNASLRKLIVESRHLHITTWLITHSLKSTVSRLIRQNTAYYLLHKQSNAGFLVSLWEENLSLFVDKKEFMTMCKDMMTSQDYICIVIDSDRSVLDCNAMSWNEIKNERELILKSNNTVYHKKDDTQKANKDNTIKPNPKIRSSASKFPSFKSFKIIDKNRSSIR